MMSRDSKLKQIRTLLKGEEQCQTIKIIRNIIGGGRHERILRIEPNKKPVLIKSVYYE